MSLWDTSHGNELIIGVLAAGSPLISCYLWGDSWCIHSSPSVMLQVIGSVIQYLLKSMDNHVRLCSHLLGASSRISYLTEMQHETQIWKMMNMMGFVTDVTDPKCEQSLIHGHTASSRARVALCSNRRWWGPSQDSPCLWCPYVEWTSLSMTSRM